MSSKLMRVASVLILLALLTPAHHPALAAPPLPPVDMFQLPWELGKAWVAYEGFDNGLRRHAGSPHNYNNGGAVDFAPHPKMKKGEDTSQAWVTAAAAGTVVATSSCHLIIAHADGWITQYQHLANFQVKLGDAVQRNQRLAVIANASTQPVCLGSVDTDTPHLHFSLRPNMVGATFAGWEFKYNALFNSTTFVKNGNSLGLFQPLLNEMSSAPTPTPSAGTPVPTGTTAVSTPTSTPPSGPYVSTTVDTPTISVGDTALVSVRLNNVPTEGYTSAEFTCTYDSALVEVSNITFANLFGVDAATTISGPQNGSFIVAIAGSKGNKATTSGVVFAFNVKGLQAGQISLGCTARVSQGSGTLSDLPAVGTSLTIVGISPTATPSPPPTSTPTPFTQPTSTFTPTVIVPSATATSTSPVSVVPPLSFVPVAGGLSQPVFVTHAGDGSGRLFVLERAGRIRVITSAASLLSTPFLDIDSLVGSSSGEEGILGLAFHPSYESNGLFFVTYTNNSGNLVLAKYSVSSDPNLANPASAAIVLTIPHPGNSNHNGGMLAFGADGYLYWSTGDGGGAGDIPNNAQNTNSLLGKILRLDINSGSPYAVPPDNPFVGVSGVRGEIWGYGFRNPWRFSFDRATWDMYIGDVGQGAREEIDFEPASSTGGLNYGWRVMEGTLCYNPSSGCDTSGKVLPVTEYVNNSATCAVTGGYVYRGSLSPQMTGIYFYGDYCSGEIWGLVQPSPGVWVSTLSVDTSFFISSFGEDEAGELYLTDYASGTVQRVVGPLGAPTPTFTPSVAESPTPSLTSVPLGSPTSTFTPVFSPTATSSPLAVLTGQLFASKVVNVQVYDLNQNFIASVNANPDGTFRFDLPPGTYTLFATANGFLRIEGTVTLTAGETRAMPVVSLLAGDIDDDGSIDQFDAMTIGFSYGNIEPPGADLNSDGIINIFDLELLAQNYRKTGPVPWE
ncbi:MAG: PQQ-dependent sugar dehydrogenase [Anaerolineales bacterium]|nr:MAG: PQQ-dependent sugar dehydrogenase [Anaerolineales bacterium]